MEARREELMKLKSYTEGIDNELTMILQTLQWDRKHFLQNPMLVTCRFDSNHKVPPDKTEGHEKECFLRQNGYSKDDQLLPDPLDLESNTLVKLKKEDIEQIIANASRSDCLFKKVYRKIVQRSEPPPPFCIDARASKAVSKILASRLGLSQRILKLQEFIQYEVRVNKKYNSREAEPLSLERLQVSYSANERRAIHDAVVSAVPSCHDLTDLALLSGVDDKSSQVILSRQEILLELRNMRRRRTKYRVAAKSRNYSDVLRDVIRTQMEYYNDGKSETEPKETVDRVNNQRETHNDRRYSRPASKEDRSRYDGKIVPKPIKIKIEKEDFIDRSRDYSRERSDRAYRHEIGSRDRRDRHNDRRGRDDRSRERRNDDDLERIQRYGEHSRKRRHDDETRERSYYYEESGRKENDQDREYRYDKRSKRSHRHKDYDPEHQVKKEPGLDDEPNNLHGDTSRERRYDDKRDKAHRHKDKKERRRDRERSKERRRDKRYEEGPSERTYIKQEREDCVTRDDTINYEKEKADRKRKSKSKRHDRSNRDGTYDSHSYEIKQENYERYYDELSEEIYDPNKQIKEEK